jgi:surfactin synthase thioesterase subunit/malonyl CoA-acyl carrier protein transacylase/acyl carrier protein
MGRELWQQQPLFQDTLETCDALLQTLAGWSLIQELITVDEAGSRLTETAVAQPVLFALQVALARLWRSWGIEPQAVVGHSIGEVAAAHIAGVLSLEDAVQVVFHRSRLMQQASGQGQMAAVELSVPEAESLLQQYEGRLAIAAINSPTSVVLSGEAAALEAVLQTLQQQQIFARLLPVNCAFHSPQMQPFQSELVRSLANIQPQPNTIPIVSTVTGQPMSGAELDATYWGRNLREPVQLAAAIAQLLQTRHTLFLEISPHPVLAMNLSQCLRHADQDGAVLPTLRRQEPEQTVMLNSLGKLYTLGVTVDWAKLYPTGRQWVSLPSYPWQRSRYWVETLPMQRSAVEQQPEVSNSSNGARSATPVGATPDATEPIAVPSLTREQILTAAPDDRPSLLASYFRGLLAKVLGTATTKLDGQQPLYSLGLDSLMAAELRTRIESDLGIVLAWEALPGLNVTGFATYILKQILETTEPESTIAAVADPVSPERLWLPQISTQPEEAQLRLFCLPYAGGGASLFQDWAAELSPEIAVCPIQLPGREDRLGETLFTRMAPLCQTLVKILQPYLDKPFAIFGHSLGALISFELTRELRRQGLPLPMHVLVSAHPAPQLPDLRLPSHRLPDAQLIESLRSLNGTPEAVLQNPDLMQLLLPILRADLAIVENYIYAAEAVLSCPISVFGGLDDRQVPSPTLEAWRQQTHNTFRLHLLSGDHFFLQSERTALLQAISQELQPAFSIP